MRCEDYKILDKLYGTTKNSPLHHDNRCKECKMSDFVYIYESRHGTDTNKFEYINDPPEWLTGMPWHITEEVRLLHKNSKVPTYFRRRRVSNDEAFQMEEDYLNFIANEQ